MLIILYAKDSYVCIHVHIYIYTCICVYVHIYIHLYTYIHMCIVCVCVSSDLLDEAVLQFHQTVIGFIGAPSKEDSSKPEDPLAQRTATTPKEAPTVPSVILRISGVS